MVTIAVWLLIAISDGSYNGGSATTLATLPTGANCGKAKQNIERQAGKYRQEFYCVPATIVAPQK